MKAFVFFSMVFVAAVAGQQESCYKDVDNACSQSSTKTLEPGLAHCNATYGPIHILSKDLIDYANNHIVRSFEYLLMSTHYGNYQKNRAGFEKLFLDLSDSKWQTSIEIIKHLTKRGGTMKFLPPKILTSNGIEQPRKNIYELYEIQSIAKALDIEKQLALEAFHIHNEASQRHSGNHDPEIAHYIEEEFVEGQAGTVRKLAGYVADLNSMLSGPDGTLSLFLFDEYLQKQ